MMLRFAAGIVLCGLVAGCVEQPPRHDPGTCLALFGQLDRSNYFYGDARVDPARDRLTQPPRTARFAQQLQTRGCVTRSRDLVGLEELGARLRPHQIVSGGEAIRPTAVHAGAVDGFVSEARVTAFFGSLGYDSRGRGQEGLGRRIYLGPFRDTASMQQAIDIARQAGFVSPYASRYERF